ncbi:L-serine ammonia-lyase, iron-sulfur-dependent subunit beta [Clostridium gasigenes]|uniref:L-serine ammonia-lyase, iron-sulfur-dependent subunit beta n=1 Tax=Clostridium gasigenes TaxID=94869 RepID=UPI0014385453|nr:L-serine ammonia-lyase, iron-sulfur-dependent subunit beta [Clostridium gasigenes]MBU3103492.1 L-serine ammonia-lyase, iron-sulfur-dependent subunit beta [Clostridium gasigenes]NKF07212.1 L-serine ammonia-lyase, iron-sulfur-dependent, subunit beta [Clostridium gasigenes]QSW21452.1 L-serine ammonia-lyase, iron-sulfur-dependent subunit beta [Clostridium gasigenes]
MKNFGVFDILGPIMVGPSSSHTAGAARLGKIAKTIVGNDIKEVTFLLHGSFGKTYKGHGTDRALVAGILGMEPSDDRLKNSIEIAENKGLIVNFVEEDLGQVHPNTVKFLITDIKDNTFEVMGSSIGGGNVEIIEINGNSVQITGIYPTIITCHNDIPGTVAKVSELIYSHKINIAFMKLVRGEKGKSATMTFEVDTVVPDSLMADIKKINGINKVIVINPETGGKHNDSKVS